MKILFDEIPETGLHLEIKDTNWFPDGDWLRVGPAQADLSITRRNRQVILDGRLQYVNQFECDCCLETYEDKRDERFLVEFEYLPPGDPYWRVDAGEHECLEDQMDVVFLDEPALYIENILEQQVLLMLPAKRVCSDGCRGLCSQCGKNLNNYTCSCQDLQPKTSFEALAKVKGR